MNNVLRTLIIEDSEDDTLLLISHLTEGGYHPHWQRVDSRNGLQEALNAEPWDIVFADYTIPGFSGTEALEIIRRRGFDMPFIFVSGTIGEDVAVDAMRGGAQDYVMKGSPKRLLPAVDRELREARMRRQRRRAEQNLDLMQSMVRAANEARDTDAALTAAVNIVCEAAGWPLAQVWVPNTEGVALECTGAWYCRRPGLEKFRTTCLDSRLAPQQGLPGRTWATARPVWLDSIDVAEDPRLALLAPAIAARAAFGLPVRARDEVLAIMEFFIDAPRDQDSELVNVLGNAVEQLAGIIQRKRAEERLHYLAHHDPLCGLPNRVLFLDRLQQALVDSTRHRRTLGVAFIDLDRFKTINDSLGHDVGDLFLKTVAERLTANLRAGDTVARLAGDEFTVIMNDLQRESHAAFVARKILDSLSKPMHIRGHELYASASIGITLCPPDEASVDTLLRNADIAMYRAKERGGNVYEFFSPDMTEKAQARLTMEKALHRALQRNEFLLHHQPIVSLHDERPVAFEALLRWNDPARGLIPPDEFVPLAEETGLIMRIGRWVLMQACKQKVLWNGHRPSVTRIAVNVSTRQFQQPDFVRSVMDALNESGLDPNELELEITETLLMQNAASARKAMRELGAIGVNFSVDDFGTGYSSLAYLKHLPISSIKIDQSFVRGIPDDENDAAIIAAIISMARRLGIQVIAEGIETHRQMEFLRDEGCDAAQGYYVGRPTSAEELTRFMQSCSGTSR